MYYSVFNACTTEMSCLSNIKQFQLVNFNIQWKNYHLMDLVAI